MIRVGLSTAGVNPLSAEHAFRLARLAGFDGVEVVVTNDDRTRDARWLLALSMRYELPILAIQGQPVWRRDPRETLERSVELASDVGAPTVVVHPPFRWQSSYAREFEALVRQLSQDYGVTAAVHNVHPLRVAGLTIPAHAPADDPTLLDCDALTLDLSHAELAGRDPHELARLMGPRLRHVHLGDGVHPMGVARVLGELAAADWSGSVIAEHALRRTDDAERVRMLRETLDSARTALGRPRPER